MRMVARLDAAGQSRVSTAGPHVADGANTRGALLMMASMGAFTLNDALVKSLGADVPLFQIVTLRGLVAAVLIAVLAYRVGALNFRLSSQNWKLIAVRSMAEVGATYFFLTALMAIPLANITAVLQILPLTVTLGAVLFFGERVGPARGAAIAAGFFGMLLIVRPGPDGFSVHAVYALCTVACVTLRDLVTRKIGSDVPSLTVTLIGTLTVLFFASVASTQVEWVALDVKQGATLVLAALFIGAAFLCSVLVMRSGEISFIAPFRYTGLVWALVLGWLIFGEWPDALTALGAAFVVGSGMFALYRESKKRASAAK